jgi:hypothetical protein
MEWRDAFAAYLEGYLMSFDLYPVCDSELYERDDAKALAGDLAAILGDLECAAQMAGDDGGIPNGR